MSLMFFIRWALPVDIKILNLKISKIRFRKELSQDHIVSDRTGIPGQIYMISKPILVTLCTQSQRMLELKRKLRYARLLNLNEKLGLESRCPYLPTPITWVVLFSFSCQSATFQAFPLACTFCGSSMFPGFGGYPEPSLRL